MGKVVDRDRCGDREETGVSRDGTEGIDVWGRCGKRLGRECIVGCGREGVFEVVPKEAVSPARRLKRSHAVKQRQKREQRKPCTEESIQIPLFVRKALLLRRRRRLLARRGRARRRSRAGAAAGDVIALAGEADVFVAAVCHLAHAFVVVATDLGRLGARGSGCSRGRRRAGRAQKLITVNRKGLADLREVLGVAQADARGVGCVLATVLLKLEPSREKAHASGSDAGNLLDMVQIDVLVVGVQLGGAKRKDAQHGGAIGIPAMRPGREVCDRATIECKQLEIDELVQGHLDPERGRESGTIEFR